MKSIWRFLREEDGASGVEYGILVAAVAAVIIIVALAVGGKVSNGFQATNANMTTAPFTGS